MITAWYEPHKNSKRLQIDIGAIDEFHAPPPPRNAEFNDRGGISLDFDGAWDAGTTIELPPESLAVVLMKIAWVVAYSETLEVRKAALQEQSDE